MATYSLDFNGYYLSTDSLPEETGVYLVYTCVYNKSTDKVTLKRLLYIGKSLKTENTNLRNEVKQHVDNGRFAQYIGEGERYRLRLCEADMKQLVGLPQQSNYYGERCRFLHGYQKAGDLSCLKNLTYYLAI